MSPSKPKLRGMALAWFRAEDWPMWQAMDPAFMPTYEAWRQRMDRAYAQCLATGVPALKVTLDPAEFQAWAQRNGRDFGTQARAVYAVLKMNQDERDMERRH